MWRSRIFALSLLMVVILIGTFATGLAGKLANVVADVVSGNATAVAFLQVARVRTPIMDRDTPQESDRAYEIYKETQARLIRSPFVISAALRYPGISQLPIVRSQENPVAWVNGVLSVLCSPQSELIQVQMKGPDAT
jgi:hypothetical protein